MTERRSDQTANGVAAAREARATAALTRVLEWAVRRLPPAQRVWGEAVRAEAPAVPAGPARLRWLAGGLCTVALRAGLWRGVARTTLAALAGAVLVWLGWHRGSANPAMPTDRVALIVTVALLAVLPMVVRLRYGPVAGNRTARVVRTGGYLAVYALVGVIVGLSRFAGSRFDHFQAFDQANWSADMRSGAIVSAVAMIAIVGGYAVAVLMVTAGRAAVAPRTLALGTAAGAAVAGLTYALTPFGNPLHPGNGWLTAGYVLALLLLPVAAVCALVRLRAGALGGVWAGGTAALLLAVLTIATMVFFPEHVDLKWANPSAAVPHGTPFEIQMSVSDTAVKYFAGLVLGPLVGLLLGGATAQRVTAQRGS
jgi:hypothetical protein